MIKKGDWVLYTGKDYPNKNVIKNKPYKTASITGSGSLRLEGVDSTWNKELFTTINELIAGKKYSELSLELKLAIIEIRYRGESVECSKDLGHTWISCYTLETEGIHMYAHRQYRVKNNTETLEAIAKVEDQMKELQKQLDALKSKV